MVELEYKKCRTCELVLPIKWFDTNGYNDGVKRDIRKYHAHCKLCTSEQVYRQFIDRVTRALREINKECKCEVCGDVEFCNLDLHHSDPSKKEIIISRLRGHSYERIKAEVQKCVVLCSKCHRLEHKRLKRQEIQEQRERCIAEAKIGV